jgi:hypothetical protein
LVDPLTLAMGVMVGAGAGLGISYSVFYRRPSQPKVRVVQRSQSGEVKIKTIALDELERSKRELRTITLERDLLSSALTKVYEAETEGQITRDERESIARRYSQQIREIESKLRDRELLVEVWEMEQLRDELVSLFREKIQNIEGRLDAAKERLQPLRPEPATPRLEGARKSTVSASSTSSSSSASSSPSLQQVDELERAIERKAPKKEETDGEKRVRELREEVMDALAKLEQIDTKRETEKA